MKKFIIGALLGALAVVVFQDKDARDPSARLATGRPFIDARTSVGVDLEKLFESNLFNAEQIKSLRAADCDGNGYLSDAEYDAWTPPEELERQCLEFLKASALRNGCDEPNCLGQFPFDQPQSDDDPNLAFLQCNEALASANAARDSSACEPGPFPPPPCAPSCAQ